jgi:hypothetical protein
MEAEEYLLVHISKRLLPAKLHFVDYSLGMMVDRHRL